MSDFEKFKELIRTLRGENGCPWDKKQTLQTLAPYILEESQEVAEAVECKTDADVCEELGDVMLIVLMMAQVAEEQGRFNFDDCVKAISEKIIRRHPHVFGERRNLTENEIIDNWQKIKEREKQGGAER